MRIYLRNAVAALADILLKGTDGAAHVLEQGNITGLRNPSSSTNSYVPVKRLNNLAVISKTTAVTIGGGAANDTQLFGIHIYNTLTGTCVITGFADSDGAAQSITIPATTTARFIDFGDAINTAGALTVTCSNAADDNLVAVLWRPV